VKNHKIGNNSATAEARERISRYLESLEHFDVGLTTTGNYKSLLYKISHRSLGATKLLSG
jgi:hypothetical protein